MSVPCVPHPTYHLRIFGFSLALLIVCLVGMLFGVHLEAIVPSTGIITARDLREVRSTMPGLVELGWHEGHSLQSGTTPLAVRLDVDGNGRAAGEPPLPVQQGVLVRGNERQRVQQGQFHRLEPGDVLWPGQPILTVRDESLRLQLQRIEDELERSSPFTVSEQALVSERDRLREHQSRGVLHAPDSGDCWLVLQLWAAPLQHVGAGDVLVTIVAADPETHQPVDLVARLEIDERDWAGVAVGQKVRLSSSLFNPRLHGHAEAVVDRLAPWGQEGTDGQRRFHAEASITHSPHPLPLGSSFQAEISVGRKHVYRLILEH